MSWISACVFVSLSLLNPLLISFLAFRFDLSDVETLKNVENWIAEIARYASDAHQKVLVGIECPQPL